MSDKGSKSAKPLRCSRRQLLTRGSLLAAALLAAPPACSQWSRCNTSGRNQRSDSSIRQATEPPSNPAPPDTGDETKDSDLSNWQNVRRRFDVDPDLVHMAGMLLSTHPRRVREAIDRHRRGLNDNPVDYLIDHRTRSPDHLDQDAEEWAMRAAGRYLQMDPANIALTGNTTMGLAMVYNGLHIDADQEIVTGHWNHWATEGSLQYRAQKTGCEIRRAVLYDELATASRDELVDRLIDAVSPATRIVAVTWVHSVSGLKLPIGRIGQRIKELNHNRSPSDRIIFCVDGVHGFGVEDASMADFHCDFFIAGCHKWLFGPRGTGIVAASPDAWRHITPTTPTFSGHLTPGRRFTPGGFHAFEHRWALNEAFEFHFDIGKSRIQDRIHGFTDHLLDALAPMEHVRLRTPQDRELTSGIVTFEVQGHTSAQVTAHLRRQGVIASTTPETHRVPRLSPGLLNDYSDIEQTIDAIAELGTGG